MFAESNSNNGLTQLKIMEYTYSKTTELLLYRGRGNTLLDVCVIARAHMLTNTDPDVEFTFVCFDHVLDSSTGSWR